MNTRADRADHLDRAGPTWSDTGIVLLSGPAPWWGSERGGLPERLAGYSMTSWSLASLALVTVASWRMPLAVALVAVGLATFTVPVVAWNHGRPWLFGRRPAVLVPLRIGAVAAWALGIAMSDVSYVLAALAGGMVLGAEASLSLRGIGVRLGLARAVGRYVVSPVHLGVVVGLAVAVSVVDLPADDVLHYYAVTWAGVATLIAAIVAFHHFEQRVRDERASVETHVKADQHRSRAHWIHDDVCSELRFTRMQLEQQQIDTAGLLHALADLDHRLRLRQLDEQVDSGHVRIAEVVQPFVRTLQDRGIDIVDVPPYDVANTSLTPATARAARHALSVLVTNAIQARATRVSIRCTVTPGRLLVEVEDDAGGFHLEDLPVGRGLDGLRHELTVPGGPPPIEVETTNDGTCVRVRVPDGAST